uniref:CUB domain-containing protein n=1 Tax=Caenorhabditis tropicalis TaxID=1561998 RepID=A0A1I7UDI8_9PELO
MINFKTLIILQCLAHFNVASYCEDNWKLLNRKGEAMCWKLVNLENKNVGYSTAVSACKSTESTPATIRNAAEKQLLADMSARNRSSLVCYATTQSAVERKFKSIDYEEPPVYLKELNQNGKVKLSRRIRQNDEITISFSFKIPKNKLKAEELTVRIRLGSSSNSSLYAIDMRCKRTRNIGCDLYSIPNPTYDSFSMSGKEEYLSTEYFGTITFKFKEKEILFAWGDLIDDNDHKIISERHFSYSFMDEIQVENAIVSSIQHSLPCTSSRDYTFKTEEIAEGKLPPLPFQQEKMAVKRRSLGSDHRFLIPESRLDYWNQEDEMPILFDIYLAKLQKNQTISVEFGSPFHLNLTSSSLSILHLSHNSSGSITSRLKLPGNFEMDNYPTLMVRFHVSVKPSHLEILTTIHRHGKHPQKLLVRMPILVLEEIRMHSDSSSEFYDVQMKSLREVTMTTCAFRTRGIDELQMSTVPYISKCFDKKSVLCERKASDSHTDEIRDEPEVAKFWELGIEEEIKQEKERKKIQLEKEMKEKEKKIENLDGFQWGIVFMSSLILAAVLAILILNLIHCWV